MKIISISFVSVVASLSTAYAQDFPFKKCALERSLSITSVPPTPAGPHTVPATEIITEATFKKSTYGDSTAYEATANVGSIYFNIYSENAVQAADRTNWIVVSYRVAFREEGVDYEGKFGLLGIAQTKDIQQRISFRDNRGVQQTYSLNCTP